MNSGAWYKYLIRKTDLWRLKGEVVRRDDSIGTSF